VEQLQGPFEKFVDWRQCITAMLFCLPLPLLHNDNALDCYKGTRAICKVCGLTLLL